MSLYDNSLKSNLVVIYKLGEPSRDKELSQF